MAPDATSALVKMRGALLNCCGTRAQTGRHRPQAPPVSGLTAAFELRVIDWNPPAAVLERIIPGVGARHSGLGRSALPATRKSYVLVFFHPAMPDDPLVFVEVALTSGIPTAIAPLIDKHPSPLTKKISTLWCLSIATATLGWLVSFGNFLIKQVVEEVGKRYPKAKRYVTLSPVPDL